MMMQRVCLFDPLVAAGGPQPSKVNSRKSLFHGFCLFFFVSLSAFGGVEAEMCGIPGRSQKGIVALQHSTSSYNSGQRAEYSCQHAFTQLGNATRICQHGGLWSGTWPRCAANVAFKKAVASSPIIDGYRANSLVDADTQSCIYLDMQVLDRYVQIDLGTNQLIAGLVIHIPEGYIQEVSIFVAEKLTTSSGIQYRRCTNSLSRIEPSKTHVECKSETGKIGVTGRFIHIRDEREIKDFYFALCEVEVYTKEVTATCGVPDSPAFGNHSILGHHTTEFSCQTGFYLDGARYLTCHQGNWIGHAPRCIRNTIQHYEFQTVSKDCFKENFYVYMTPNIEHSKVNVKNPKKNLEIIS